MAPASERATSPSTMPRQVVGAAIVLAILLGIARFETGYLKDNQAYYLKIAKDAGVNIILAVSLNLVNGFTGQFSMGHAGFMATGAYVASWMTTVQPQRTDPLGADGMALLALMRWGFIARGIAILLVLVPVRRALERHDRTVARRVRTGAGSVAAVALGLLVVSRALGLPLWPWGSLDLGMIALAGVSLTGEASALFFADFYANLGAWALALGLADAIALRAIDAVHGTPDGGWARQALFLLAIVMAGLYAAAAGYLVGIPSLRLRGDYLAIVTLGFGEIIRVLILNVEEVGGARGLSGIPQTTDLFWGYLWVVITVVAVYRLTRSSHGRAFLAVREDEIAAEAMGVNTTSYKVKAFVISSFFAGVAGALFAHIVGTINPSSFTFLKSFDVIIMIVLGGLGSITGSIVAAVLLSILPELLRAPPPEAGVSMVWLKVALLVALIALVIRVLRAVGGGGASIPVRAGALSAGLATILVALRLIEAYTGSDLRMVVYSLILILLMLMRPLGLFGTREIWELWPGRAAPARPD